MWPSSLPRQGHDGGEKNTSAGLAVRQNAAFPTAHHGPPRPLRLGLPPAAAPPRWMLRPSMPALSAGRRGPRHQGARGSPSRRAPRRCRGRRTRTFCLSLRPSLVSTWPLVAVARTRAARRRCAHRGPRRRLRWPPAAAALARGRAPRPCCGPRRPPGPWPVLALPASAAALDGARAGRRPPGPLPARAPRQRRGPRWRSRRPPAAVALTLARAPAVRAPSRSRRLCSFFCCCRG